MKKRKKEELNVTDEHREMSEIKATGNYLRTLKDVYKEEGTLAAVGYELKSSLYSLGYTLADLWDHYTSDGKHPKWGSIEEKEFAEAQERIEAREGKRVAYLLRYQSKQNGKGLEKTLAITSVLGLIGGIFFYATRLTGNVIGISTQTSSLIGVGLLIVGLIAGFAWIKLKKQ